MLMRNQSHLTVVTVETEPMYCAKSWMTAAHSHRIREKGNIHPYQHRYRSRDAVPADPTAASRFTAHMVTRRSLCTVHVKIMMRGQRIRLLTLSADGAEDDAPLAAGDETEEDGDQGESDEPVNVASIEELPAVVNGGPSLTGKHGEVPEQGL